MPLSYAASLAGLRRLLLLILVLGLIGTGTELLLMGHYEDVWQLVPLVLIGLALLAAGWRAARPAGAALATFRGVMALLIASGAVGTWRHYRGNAEFELEMTPGLAGFALFAESMTGATPALAPGAMALLGLVGLASAYRLAPRPSDSPPSPE